MSIEIFDPFLTFDEEAYAAGQAYTLGDRARDDSGNEYIFVRGSGDTLWHRYCARIRPDGSATRATYSSTNDYRGERVGFTVYSEGLRNNHYGWLQIYGIGLGRLQPCSAHDQLYTDSSSGRLDDDSANQNRILNVYPLENNTSNSARTLCIMRYPRYG